MRSKLFISILLLVGCSLSGFATHILSGEITYKKVYPNNPNNGEFEVIVNTELNAESPADRPYLYILYGDEDLTAELDSIERIDVYIVDDIRYSTYKSFHTYAEPGEYLIQIEDVNRSGGILNMEESLNQSFFIESMLSFNSDGVTTNENSVVLLNSNVPVACLGETWAFNAACFDIDGDSLGYELVSCKGSGGLDIDSWNLPDAIPGVSYNGDLYIYPDGTIFWENPLLTGAYTIALKVSEYSQGVEIGYVIKDFTIVVETCFSEPIEFTENVSDIEVYPWTEIEFSLVIDNLTLPSIITAAGGPLTEIYNTATFSSDVVENQVLGTFNWTPNFGDVRDQPYLLVFNTNRLNPNDQSDIVRTEIVQITVLDPGENSIEDLETTGVVLYPNPTSDYLFIEMTSIESQDYTIYDLSGRAVTSGVIRSKNESIDVSHLASDIYLLEINHELMKWVKD